LSSTENKIAFARQAYNDAVMVYNTRVESFPAVLVATGFGFRPAALYQIEEAAERAAPQVSFGK
jgi:LemA protein